MTLPEVAGISAWEYDKWHDYFDRRPPLEETVPQLLATLCCLVYNALLSGKNPQQKVPADFMYWVKKEDIPSLEDGEQQQELTLDSHAQEKLLESLQGGD